MNEGIISLILQAENEYHGAVKRADIEAEVYADDCVKRQNAYFKELRQEWEAYEKAENENLEERLLKAEQKIEKETAQMKEQLKARQEKMADAISERLKQEVLTVYGNC